MYIPFQPLHQSCADLCPQARILAHLIGHHRSDKWNVFVFSPCGIHVAPLLSASSTPIVLRTQPSATGLGTTILSTPSSTSRTSAVNLFPGPTASNGL